VFQDSYVRRASGFADCRKLSVANISFFTGFTLFLIHKALLGTCHGKILFKSDASFPAQQPPYAAHMSPPKIEPHSFVTLHYRLAGPQGDLINTFTDKPATLTLGSSELSPALEQALLGLAEGVHTTLEIAPGEAFGPRNPDMLQWVKHGLLEKLSDPSAVYLAGDVVQFPTPQGNGHYAGTVIQSSDTAVLFDFNHPLAGQAVTFEVQVLGVL